MYIWLRQVPTPQHVGGFWPEPSGEVAFAVAVEAPGFFVLLSAERLSRRLALLPSGCHCSHLSFTVLSSVEVAKSER